MPLNMENKTRQITGFFLKGFIKGFIKVLFLKISIVKTKKMFLLLYVVSVIEFFVLLRDHTIYLSHDMLGFCVYWLYFMSK